MFLINHKTNKLMNFTFQNKEIHIKFLISYISLQIITPLVHREVQWRSTRVGVSCHYMYLDHFNRDYMCIMVKVNILKHIYEGCSINNETVLITF